MLHSHKGVMIAFFKARAFLYDHLNSTLANAVSTVATENRKSMLVLQSRLSLAYKNVLLALLLLALFFNLRCFVASLYYQSTS